MKWKNLLMPKEIIQDESVATDTFGRFIVEPLERGFGVTIGNALRRALLSSIQGAAVTGVKVEGALHEMSNLPGVVEDVTDIILNLKQMVLILHADEPKFLNLDVEKEGDVLASDITATSDIEILNPDLHIATLNEKTRLQAKILVGYGRGYAPSESHDLEDHGIGMVPVDSNFSPVKNVTFTVEDTRVGHRTDYDKITLEVTTDGSISPEDALGFAAKVVKDHMLLFIHFEEPVEEKEEEVDEEREKLRELLGRSVEELELSVRSSNCLRAANIKTLGDLVKRTESEMLKYRNFGRKSLKEISDILEGMGLQFGMTFPEGAGEPAALEETAESEQGAESESESESETVETASQ
jgi:DNA-directed RNA polymerase subunit alpha